MINDWREYEDPANNAEGTWEAGTYKIVETDGEAYQYYRYFNYDDHGANYIGEFKVVASAGWSTPVYEAVCYTHLTLPTIYSV